MTAMQWLQTFDFWSTRFHYIPILSVDFVETSRGAFTARQKNVKPSIDRPMKYYQLSPFLQVEHDSYD